MVIGRDKEIVELNRLYSSHQAQFVAIYGRRRVGKTFLVDEVFKGRITIRHAGLSPVETDNKKDLLREQLRNFYYSLLRQGMKKSRIPSSWLEAFFLLETYLEKIDNGKRQLVFLDELPWMDTPRSGFMTALESFWNGWGCHRDNFMLVVCGSATSWMQDKLVNNHGGLYDRLTYEIKLSPFTLKECEQYFKAANVQMSRYDITQCYMSIGGIPYYLGYFQTGKSFAQNIDNMFFDAGARLTAEYDRLFTSVFTRPDDVKRIVECLSARNYGFTRNEISDITKLSNNGNLTKMLYALIASDFVVKFVPFGHSKREEYYKLVDPFCIFYIRFVLNNSKTDKTFWIHNENTPVIVSWRGIAFENVCLSHIKQIKHALGIDGVASSQSSWALKGDDEHKGAQIDLLIDRADHVLNLCEVKFYSDDFTVDKDYYRKLQYRQKLLSDRLPKRTAIHQTLVTTYGLKYNEYSGIFQNVVTLEDLFAI